MILRLGQVVVTEVNRRSWLSRQIAARTGSPATHAFVVGGNQQGVEAHFPQVRSFSAPERLARLEAEDRAYVVLDYPEITLIRRMGVAIKAREYIGRFYDVGQMLLYGLTGAFWNDGTGTLLCSRLVTASFHSGAGLNLFDEETLAQFYPPTFHRLANLRNGYCTPPDLLRSKLHVVGFHPSSRVQTVEDFQIGGAR